ncbi:hypothetical protein [Ochrobactrum soli]|uniref:Uncharacterized protein n=1 Tax=Ochrobactrum soli TaxID=2448455 RepID=A0A849KRN3_9HYPH|nr:hypothetical protein [[Ochrobactrum] soli]NNU62933.1 hypothetical protein [[Ochrobactrum] soli]
MEKDALKGLIALWESVCDNFNFEYSGAIIAPCGFAVFFPHESDEIEGTSEGRGYDRPNIHRAANFTSNDQ